MWPGTAGVLSVQSCTSDRRLVSARVEKKEPRRYCPFSARCGAWLSKKLRSDYGAGVPPHTAKPRLELVPRECACQGQSKNSSGQMERRRYGRALRTRGSCGCRMRAIGKVSYHRGQVMEPVDLQRYHRLLLKKQREVSSALGEAQSRVPAAGGLVFVHLYFSQLSKDRKEKTVHRTPCMRAEMRSKAARTRRFHQNSPWLFSISRIRV